MEILRKWLAGRETVKVREEHGVRQLHIGGSAIQSAIRLDDPDALALDYVRAMMAFLLFCPRPRDVLMVGLGGGSMARFVRQRMRRARVTVAEINPEVLAAARKYFHFPEDDARLKTVIADGAELVSAYRKNVDVLVVDGFVNGSPAKSLCTQPFYDAAFAALREGGVLVANFMSDDKRLARHCERIEKSFGRQPVQLLAEEKDNLIVFAMRGGPSRIAWGELKARAKEAKTLYDLDFDKNFVSLRRRNPHTERFLTI